MGSNIIELAKLGHERAAELKASCGAVDVRSLAQLISDLATQLEVQFVRSTNMAVQLANAESKCRELAAELSAVDKIHNEAVFITDDHYEQCPPKVQKMIRSLAVLQILALLIRQDDARVRGRIRSISANRCGKCGDELPVKSCPCDGDSACWVTRGWHETKLSV